MLSPINANTNIGRQTNFGHSKKSSSGDAHNDATQSSKRSKLLIPATIAGSAVGILGALTLLSRGKMGGGRIAKFLNNAKIVGEHLSEIKNFNMFKPGTYVNLIKDAKYGPLDIGVAATVSTIGGLAIGSAIDSKNRKSKLKEAFSQIVGNIAIPITFMTAASALMKKTLSTKLPPMAFKIAKIPISIIALGLGLFAGNKVTNLVNKKIFQDNDERKMKLSDLSSHIDDGCTTIGLVGKGVNICETIARAVPVALVIPGVLTGLAEKE